MAARMIIPIVLIGGVIGAIVFWKDICKPIGDVVKSDVCGGGKPILDQIADVFKPITEGGSNANILEQVRKGLVAPPQAKNVIGAATTHGFTPEQAAIVSIPHPISAAPEGPQTGIAAFEDNCKSSFCKLVPSQCPKCVNGHFTGFARSNLGEISLYRMSIG